jgi:hypothetical protein
MPQMLITVASITGKPLGYVRDLARNEFATTPRQADALIFATARDAWRSLRSLSGLWRCYRFSVCRSCPDAIRQEETGR